MEREGIQAKPRGENLVKEQELPEGDLFRLLAAIGNNEAKCLTLIAMGNGHIFSEGDLYRTMLNHQGKQTGWRMGWRTPFTYCKDSLSPIGLVTKEAINPDLSVYGYQITEYGKQTGIPLAGLLLKWSLEHPDFSLYKMFASTGSKVQRQEPEDKKRAPEIRYRLFWELVTNPNSSMRKADLTQGLREDPTTIHDHLDSLRNMNVISYESRERREPYSFYKFREDAPPEPPTPYRRMTTLTIKVYDLLKENPDQEFSAEDLLTVLTQNFPEYKEKSFVLSAIRHIATCFEHQGYVGRKKYRKSLQSEIILSPEQREVILSLVSFLDRFQRGDPQVLQQGKEFAERIAADPERFSVLMRKAKEVSSFANKVSREETYADMLSIIQQSVGNTGREIQEKLGIAYDRRLNLRTVYLYLRELVQQGKLIAEPTKAGKIYRLPDPTPNT